MAGGGAAAGFGRRCAVIQKCSRSSGLQKLHRRSMFSAGRIITFKVWNGSGGIIGCCSLRGSRGPTIKPLVRCIATAETPTTGIGRASK
jgi:hypothetical protein